MNQVGGGLTDIDMKNNVVFISLDMWDYLSGFLRWSWISMTYRFN
jgi:hypothetical protein